MTGDNFTDVRYEVDESVAVITIDRPERMNAFRGRTVDELIAAFRMAWANDAVAAGVLTGAGGGAFDGGFGTAYLARVVGEKRARQIWFLLEQFDAATAERWGLVNAVVPPDQVVPTAVAWGKKIAAYSPTAIRFLKPSFNPDPDNIVGIQNLVFDAL